MAPGELLQIVSLIMNTMQVMFLAWLTVHANTVAKNLERS
jgi:hypothetical protein